MFATGCRISEARRLQWSDIDFQQRTIRLWMTKNKKERLASMPPRLLVALANLPKGTAPFDTPENTLRRHWDAAIAEAAKASPGFERLTFHSARHGFATKMLHDGVDIKTAATLGGWDDVGLFLSTYAHAMKDARLTDSIFDTPLTQRKSQPQQKQGVRRK
jgi:integrase